MRRVAIAAGDPGYQAALALLLAGEPDLHHVGSASDVTSLLALVHAHRPDVVAVDLGIAGGGVERLLAALKAEQVECGVIALALLETPTVRAAAARTSALLVDKADAAGLLAALRAGPG